MKELSQILPQVAEIQQASNYSKILSETLVGSEKTVVELKYKSLPFGKMPPLMVLSQSMLLLLKINVITGWAVPPVELKDILIEQMCRKLVEAYPTANVDEVEYAFRNRELEVKDWGKSFSITLLDEVMQPYMASRMEISKLEERIKSQTRLVEEKKEQSDEEMQEWVDDWKIKIKNIEDPMLVPPFYDWLDRKQMMPLTKEQKWDYLTNQAVVLRHYHLSELVKSEGEYSQTAKDLEGFNEMRGSGCFAGREVGKLKELAKRIAVFDYLKSFQNE